MFPARVALLLGNFITGLVILAPAGMLQPLADGFGVGIREAGLLITYGAVVLCVASPLVGWATSTIDRRLLLAGVMVLVGGAHLGMTIAPGYWSVLGLRLLIVTVVAVYTPQAASAVALLVPEKERAGAIAFVFIGWSLSVAAGMPMVTYLSSKLGFAFCFGVLGALALLCAAMLFATLPRGLKTAPFSLSSWGDVVRHRLIVLLLVMTAVQVSGQFLIITYMGPLLTALTGADASVIAIFFAIYGVGGFLGSIAATRIVGTFGAYKTSGIAVATILAGVLLWALGSGAVIVMGIGAGIWGLGFAAANSMQQARLYAAAPPLASVTVALNSSAIYVGQAIGSAIGGVMFARAMRIDMGFVAAAFVAASLGLWLLTRPRHAA